MRACVKITLVVAVVAWMNVAASSVTAQDPIFSVPQPLGDFGVKTGGWVQAGITLNGENPGDGFNGPMLTNDRDGDLMMNQLWLYFDRPCDTGGDGIDIGGRIDMLYGTDWRVAYAYGFGIEDRINGPNELYGLALPQMYAEVMVNKLSVKMGRMAGLYGFEMVPPVGNFFYSHSYAVCYAEPLLITGAMGAYPVTDQLTAQAGFHQGYRRFENNNGEHAFQGGLKWVSEDQRLTAAYALDVGAIDAAGVQDQYLHNIVLTYQITDDWRYAIQNDVGFLELPGGGDAEWYGISQQLLYTINEQWSAGARVEWIRDDDGALVFGLGNLPDARGWMGAPGYAGNFTELTLGLNWRPKPNVVFRPEVRWDWYDGLANGAGPHLLPFDNGTSRTQFTLAADVVVAF